MRDEINKTEDLQKSVAENVKKVTSAVSADTLSLPPVSLFISLLYASNERIGFTTCSFSKGISILHGPALQFGDLLKRTCHLRALRSPC